MPFINEAVYALAERRGRRRGDRHGREARLRAPDRPAGARRPDRPRHAASRSWRCSSAASATRSTRRARCCASTSRPGGSAASRAAASIDYELTPAESRRPDHAARALGSAWRKCLQSTISGAARAPAARDRAVGAGVRDGADPEELHRFRVATRRQPRADPRLAPARPRPARTARPRAALARRRDGPGRATSTS